MCVWPGRGLEVLLESEGSHLRREGVTQEKEPLGRVTGKSRFLS